MYIWILLATIMIALSFFNLSPRPDKEGVFAEVKAESIVSRFRTEHSAFSRVVECKIIHNLKHDSMPVISKFNPTEGVDKFIWEHRSLPIGYDKENSPLNVFHYSFCLKSDILKGTSPEIAENCEKYMEYDTSTFSTSRAYRYSVSFAPLPDRWRSKANDDDTVPVLNQALSRQYVKGSILGLLNCSQETGTAANCLFTGSLSYLKKNNERLAYLSFIPGGGDDFYTRLFANVDFNNYCAGNICLFAIHRLSNHDVDRHCEQLYTEYGTAVSLSEEEPGE